MSENVNAGVHNVPSDTTINPIQPNTTIHVANLQQQSTLHPPLHTQPSIVNVDDLERKHELFKEARTKMNTSYDELSANA